MRPTTSVMSGCAAARTTKSFRVRRVMAIVTADMDFADIVRFRPRTHSGIVVLRVPNTLPADNVNEDAALRVSRAWRRGSDRASRRHRSRSRADKARREAKGAMIARRVRSAKSWQWQEGPLR
jgi:hypothetical protein